MSDKQNMTIIGALESMQSGKWVSRRRWKNDCQITLRGDREDPFFSMRSKWSDERYTMLSADDVLANDWFVVSDV